MPKRIVLPESEIKDLYVIKKLSLEHISKVFNVSNSCVLTNMKHYGIKVRNLSESHIGKRCSFATEFKKGQRPHNYIDLPKEEIIRLYTEENKSSVEIGEIFNTSHKPILAILNKAGIAKKYNKGRFPSDETRRKLSLAKKGKPQPQLQTDEARRKLGDAIKAAHKIKNFGWSVVASKIREQGGTDHELYLDHLLQKNNIKNYEREYIIKLGNSRKKFSIDFAWPEIKLGVELDGDSHKRRLAHDIERDNILSSMGWKIVRFTNEMLFFSPKAVIKEIKLYIDTM